MSENSFGIVDPAFEPFVGIALRHLGDSMLQEIAASDRGEDFEAHLACLRGIARGALPVSLELIPNDELELGKGSDPGDEREH